MTPADLISEFEDLSAKFSAARDGLSEVIFGQEEVIDLTLATLAAGGHALLVGAPGLAKTLLVSSIGDVMGLSAKRVQFTPDLMPGDVLGSEVLEESADGRRAFRFIPGPIFCQLLMADEINRASPRTQSALLEAMSEGSVTVDGVTHRLPDPFLVIATQNPLEHAGTHPLPDSQLDRFLMRLRIGYPAPEDEAAVLREDPAATELPRLAPVLSVGDVRALRRSAARVKLDDAVIAYLLAIVGETRAHETIALGVSPRGAVALRRAVQARALCEGRDFAIPDDVRDLAVPVLAHRLVVDPHGGVRRSAEEVEWLVREILGRVPVPL